MSEGTLTSEGPVATRQLMRSLPGARLARLASRGSTTAFAVIYQRHNEEIYRYCRSLVGNEHDAHDALQNTMLRALRGLEGERREIAVRPWLFRIAHNESMSLLRTRDRASMVDPSETEVASTTSDLEVREQLRGLVADLEQLTPNQRSALLMRELTGLEFGEIGAVLDTSPGGAKQAVYEARVALNELAEGRDMSCEEIRRKVSAEDRRLLRGRRVRAHLRGCQECRAFKSQIGVQRARLAALFPPLSAPAAVGVLKSVLQGGGATATGGAAAAAGGASGLIGGAAVKAGIAALVIGAGVFAGADKPNRDPSANADARDADRSAHASPPGEGPAGPAGLRGESSEGASGPVAAAGSGAGDHGDSGESRPGAAGATDAPIGGPTAAAPKPEPAPSVPQPAPAADTGGDAAPQGTPPGHGGTPPGHGGTPPGHGGTPPGHGGTPPGLSAPPPGHGGTPPGQGGTPPGLGGAAPPGHGGAPPGQTGTATGPPATPPGQGGTPPGQTGTATGPPETPPGQAGTPPGQAGMTTGPPATAPGPAGTPPGHGGAASPAG